MQAAANDATAPARKRPFDRVIPISTILSLVAATVSIGAAWWTISHDPLGKGIDAYSFTTPRKTLCSQLDMVLNQDFRAMQEIDFLRSGSTPQEMRDTLKVHKESNYQGKKLLFISYERNGLPHYDVESFEKDADTGLWFPAYVSTYNMDDEALENAVTHWKDLSETPRQATFASVDKALSNDN